MNPYKYQRSRSLIDLGPRSLRFFIFKLLFLRNCLADWSQISCGASMGWENKYLFIWSRSHDQYGRSYMVKTVKKKSSSLEPKSWWPWKLVSSIWCSSTTKFVQMMTWVDLDYFTTRSNFVPYTFVWKKGKTMDFSETIVIYGIKIGRCSQLNVYMKLISTKGQGHSLSLVQTSQIQYF